MVKMRAYSKIDETIHDIVNFNVNGGLNMLSALRDTQLNLNNTDYIIVKSDVMRDMLEECKERAVQRYLDIKEGRIIPTEQTSEESQELENEKNTESNEEINIEEEKNEIESQENVNKYNLEVENEIPKLRSKRKKI